MSELDASGPTGRPLWAKLIMTVLLAVLIGPLVGTILVFLSSAAVLASEAIVMFMTAPLLTLIFALSHFGVSGGGLVFGIVIHIVPALVVWWLVRPYWKRAEA